jgi:hypothetical protein
MRRCTVVEEVIQCTVPSAIGSTLDSLPLKSSSEFLPTRSDSPPHHSIITVASHHYIKLKLLYVSLFSLRNPISPVPSCLLLLAASSYQSYPFALYSVITTSLPLFFEIPFLPHRLRLILSLVPLPLALWYLR